MQQQQVRATRQAGASANVRPAARVGRRRLTVRAAAAVESPATLAPELVLKCVNAIRFLSIDGVNKANSGHPGLPMGAAPMSYVLFNEYMKFNPKNPKWINRDRFVLSAGHGSMLQYSLLHLTGYDSVKVGGCARHHGCAHALPTRIWLKPATPTPARSLTTSSSSASGALLPLATPRTSSPLVWR